MNFTEIGQDSCFQSMQWLRHDHAKATIGIIVKGYFEEHQKQKQHVYPIKLVLL